MVEWNTLDHFIPTCRVAKRYLVTFDNAHSVDNFGFLGAGEMKLARDTVEFAGLRPWPARKRFLIFVIITLVLWFTFFMLLNVLPWDGETLAMARLVLGLCSGLITPLVTLLLIDRFCVSLTRVSMDRRRIDGVRRTGRRLSFVVLLGSGESKRLRLVAPYKLMAQEMEDALKPVLSSKESVI